MLPSSKPSRELPPSHRERAPLYALSVAITLALLVFFFNIRISFKPFFEFDAERKDDERGGGLELWEILLCACVPLLTRRYEWSLSRLLTRRVCCLQRRKAFLSIAVLLCGMAWMARRIFLRPSLCSSRREGSWMTTDVGYIRTHPNTYSAGVSMRTLCDGRTWEPHVARSIAAHLYHQGRAVDVGAFVGYHTVRMAKAAAPFDVYAIEGRTTKDLQDNIRRNNAINVRIVKETIDANWKLSPKLELDLLNDEREKGTLAFVKIDCEGCELHFLRGARKVLEKYHPVMIIEIQDDFTRKNAKLGEQQMIPITETRKDVLDYLTVELGYIVEALRDENGKETWDYLAYRL